MKSRFARDRRQRSEAAQVRDTAQPDKRSDQKSRSWQYSREQSLSRHGRAAMQSAFCLHIRCTGVADS